MILYVLILIDFIAPKFIKLIDFKYFFVYFQNAYDDRYIVQNAAAKDGIIVSNDQFRDLMDEEEAFKDAIERYNSIEIIHDTSENSVSFEN